MWFQGGSGSSSFALKPRVPGPLLRSYRGLIPLEDCKAELESLCPSCCRHLDSYLSSTPFLGCCYWGSYRYEIGNEYSNHNTVFPHTVTLAEEQLKALENEMTSRQ